jgi:putative transposase
MRRLSDEDFARWCDERHIPPAGRDLLGHIRTSRPVRRVRCGRGNVSGVTPSMAMGHGVQFESHQVELPGILAMEYGDRVLEFYDQPWRLKLTYLGPDGKGRGHLHTPDFLVIEEGGAFFDEWKSEAELEELEGENPNRYRRDETDCWRCPPGEEYAQQYGLGYRVRSDADLDWIWTRNIIFLREYLDAEKLNVDAISAAALIDLTRAEPGIALADFLEDARALGASADDVYALLVAGRIWIDLRRAPLAQPTTVSVFHSQDFARAHGIVALSDDPATRRHPGRVRIAIGAQVEWRTRRDEPGRSWKVVGTGSEHTSLLDEDGHVVEVANDALAALAAEGKLLGVEVEEPSTRPHPALERLKRASPAALADALRRDELLRTEAAEVTERTLRTYRTKARHSLATYGSELAGLLDDNDLRGNYDPRFTIDEERLIAKGIASYEQGEQRRHLSAAYGEYLKLCDEAKCTHCSYETFRKRVHARPKYEQAKSRKGRRAAYQHAKWHWFLTMTTPRQGDRPWENAHIDHTPLDVELVDSETRQSLGRAWATFLIDAYTRRLLAVAITFDPPSYRSCFLVVRECMRRHGRLPQTIVIDGGKEFRSIYFETLTTWYRITVKHRPGAQPRFGSVIERLFGTTNTKFIHRLRGNTQIMKNVRMVTKANDPKRLACWTLRALDTVLHNFQDWYNAQPHAALGNQSPDESWVEREAQVGRRAHMLATYDPEVFDFLAMATTPTGQATVQDGRGVKINNIYYWTDDFDDAALIGTKVPVRYPPYDVGTAYAYVRNRWAECHAECYADLRGHSERELELASKELRKRHKGEAGGPAISARRLADLLSGIAVTEAILLQQRHDIEARGLSDRPPVPDMPANPVATSVAVAARPGPSDAGPVIEDDLYDYEEFER